MNRKQEEFLLTRDGFSLLVMGLTGKKTLEWKIKYIQAFNAMENLIEHVIIEEVEKETYYKDIYQTCKGKCKLLVELSYLPQQKLIA